MSKTQKITAARWALTLGVILFSLRPAHSKEKPKGVTTTPPPPVASDGSDFGGGFTPDDQYARQVDALTGQIAANEKQIAAAPPGSPAREQGERQRQEYVAQGDALVNGCPSCPRTLAQAAKMTGDLSETHPEFASKAQGLADRAVTAAQQATSDPKQADKLVNALNIRSSLLVKAGEFERAYADAMSAHKINPRDATATALIHETAGRSRAAGAAPPAPPAPKPSSGLPPEVAQKGYYTPQNMELAQRLTRVNTLNQESASKLKIGDYHEALRLALEAQAVEPAGKSFITEANVLMVLDKLADAIDRMGKAIELLKKNGSPQDLANAYGQRAKLQNLTGTKEGAQAAIDDSNEALKLDPKNARAFRERGLAHETQGDPAAAEADLRRAVEFDPNMGSDADAIYKKNHAKKADNVDSENAPNRTWTRLVTAAGGVLPLVIGTTGAVFFLFAGYVLFFAKDGSFAGRLRKSLTPRRVGVGILETPEPTIPKTLDNDRYVIGRQLGAGGMGAVYEAKDTRLDRRVAIKFLHKNLQVREAEVLRFVGEAKAVAALQHPHIVQVFTIIEHEAVTYIIYERIEGKTLHEVIQASDAGLEPPIALEYLHQIASALDYAHSCKVIHRDLKPSNVMVTQVNGNGWMKVMDFGIARQIDNSRVTMTINVVGTPPYMAPEQEDGFVNKHSDQFSLGVSAYEMLTKRLLFTGPSAWSDKRSGAFARPSQIAPRLPPAIDAVFERVLNSDAAKRYASCVEFTQALDIAFKSATPRA